MMIEKIGTPAMLEQLAEEAAELSQAALKLARVLRGENPTPVTELEAWKHLVEEYTDVYQCAMELHIPVDWIQIHEKEKRFMERMAVFKADPDAKIPVSVVLEMINEMGGCDASDECMKGWDAACDEFYRRMQRFRVGEAIE